MENDRLPWRADFGGATAGSSDPGISVIGTELKMPRAGLLLLVGAGDGMDCCAANFERAVFRDRDVVELAKSRFVSYRADRTSGAGLKMYAKLKLDSKKPANPRPR
jgi:hypothetical protein